MKLTKVVYTLCFLLGMLASPVLAQDYKESHYQGIVVEVEERENEIVQQINLTTGEEKGKLITIMQPKNQDLGGRTEDRYKTGDQVVITKIVSGDSAEYFISDVYRNGALLWLGVIYAGAIILLGRFKGLKSLVSLVLSFLVLTQYLIPQILTGTNPIIVTVIGAIVIMTASLYLTHGITKKTTVALLGTLASLIITSLLAHLMIGIARLKGLGTEEAMFLLMGDTSTLNLKGLLLSGIIISALGVIDDITVTQTAIVYELKKTKQSLSVRELYAKGLSIGKEHIASVTNTLILAYAGASLPLFLLFYQNTNVPFWVAVNSQLVAEEIVSTLVGSLGLVLCVPITTYLAAVAVSRKENQRK